MRLGNTSVTKFVFWLSESHDIGKFVTLPDEYKQFMLQLRAILRLIDESPPLRQGRRGELLRTHC